MQKKETRSANAKLVSNQNSFCTRQLRVECDPKEDGSSLLTFIVYNKNNRLASFLFLLYYMLSAIQIRMAQLLKILGDFNE